MYVVQPTEKTSHGRVSRYVRKVKDVFKKISRKMSQDTKFLFHTPEHVYPSYEEVFHPTSESSSSDSGVMLNSKVYESRPTTRKSSGTFLERRRARYFNSTKGSFVEDGERYRDQSTKVTELYSGEFVGFESVEVIDTELQEVEYSTPVRDVDTLVVEVEVHASATSPPVKALEEKFVVNLYESRSSKRWKEKRRGVVPDVDAIDVHRNDDNNNIDNNINNNNNDSDKYSLHCLVKEFEEDVNHNANVGDLTVEYSKPWQELDADALYFKLKKLRDMECVKMYEVSNAVKMLKKKPDRTWSDELLAEKILLESELKYRLIHLQLRQVLTEPPARTPRHRASVTLSNFSFGLRPRERAPKGEFKDFYVLVLSHGTELLSTTAVEPQDGAVSFTERFHLKNVGEDFEARVEVFSLRMMTRRRRRGRGMWNLGSLIKKKSQGLCPMFTVYYENVNTCELHESDILKSSFVSCGSATITSAHLGDASFTFSDPTPDSPLSPGFTATTLVDDVTLGVDLSGFLTLGRPDAEDNVLFWERKWCSLNSNKFCVYNYPQDEELGKSPEVMIDLEYCFAPLAKEPANCPKRRSFVLKTGRPGTVGDGDHNVTLRKRNNFVLEKYYMVADDGKEFERWTSSINSVLECLMGWKKLVFADDYYLKA